MRRALLIAAAPLLALALLGVTTNYTTTSGNNTGDVVLLDAGLTPNAFGASIVNGQPGITPNQKLTLQCAVDGIHPGIVCVNGDWPGPQTLDGGLTVIGNVTVLGDGGFSGLVSLAGLTITGTTSPEIQCTGATAFNIASASTQPVVLQPGGSTTATFSTNGNETLTGEYVTSSTSTPQFGCNSNSVACVIGSGVAQPVNLAPAGSVTANFQPNGAENLTGSYTTSSTTLPQWFCTGSSDCGMKSSVASGSASAGAFQFNTASTLSGASDLLCAFQNNGTAEMQVDKSGNESQLGGYSTSSTTLPQSQTTGASDYGFKTAVASGSASAGAYQWNTANALGGITDKFAEVYSAGNPISWMDEQGAWSSGQPHPTALRSMGLLMLTGNSPTAYTTWNLNTPTTEVTGGAAVAGSFSVTGTGGRTISGIQWTTGSTSGTSAGINGPYTQGVVESSGAHAAPKMSGWFMLGQTTSERFWYAITTATLTAADTNGTAELCGIRFSTGVPDTKFQCCNSNGTTQTCSAMATTPAANTAYYATVDMNTGRFTNGNYVCSCTLNQLASGQYYFGSPDVVTFTSIAFGAISTAVGIEADVRNLSAVAETLNTGAIAFEADP